VGVESLTMIDDCGNINAWNRVYEQLRLVKKSYYL